MNLKCITHQITVIYEILLVNLIGQYFLAFEWIMLLC